MSASASLPHLVLVAMFPGMNALDVTGPAEVFSLATQVMPAGRPPYEVRTVGERRGQVNTFSGIGLSVEETFAECRDRPDTLLVSGLVTIGPQGALPQVDPAAVAWLRRVGPTAGRVASVCAGAHLTAAAGLLAGHRATTHWATADRLAADYPEIDVVTDPIFVQSGRMWTSAGITSSMDLALALVAADHGDRVALRVAQIMVMYVQRPGGQSQFSVPLTHDRGGREDLRRLRRWMGENLREDLSVPALAARMSMSERHFARVFRAETGSTPGAFVEQLRLEAARRLLERTDRLLDDIARCCGFRSVETLHRSFRDRLGTTPGEYRLRFRASAP
ncbi:GlxA family transcriptional regulator [Salinactinospora qingdaonensis]|uniref:DJ-1/PfpI family protein n=1 Tax=Salinactinospora qingdaonensis TaxID=702744 RepID=A0ABP7FP11_9ACTN